MEINFAIKDLNISAKCEPAEIKDVSLVEEKEIVINDINQQIFDQI